MTTATLTEKTCTIAGDTFRAKGQLKDEGFAWDPSAKTWSRSVNADDAGTVYYGDNLQGDAKSYRHHWKCYAKSDRFTITLS